MKYRRLQVELSQKPYASDPEYFLLDDARFSAAAVKVAGYQAIDLDVLGDICIKKVKRDSADPRKPRLCIYLAPANVNHHGQAVACSVDNRCQSKLGREDIGIAIRLPAVVGDLLTEVTIPIK